MTQGEASLAYAGLGMHHQSGARVSFFNNRLCSKRLKTFSFTNMFEIAALGGMGRGQQVSVLVQAPAASSVLYVVC